MPTTACPECSEDVYVDADSEQGDIISCDECGSELEIVGLDPIEVDLYEEGAGDDAEDEDEFEYQVRSENLLTIFTSRLIYIPRGSA